MTEQPKGMTTLTEFYQWYLDNGWFEEDARLYAWYDFQQVRKEFADQPMPDAKFWHS